ncbi:MAG: hypothetical protein RLZZ546_1568 [Bacteroidota bacterium]|jgi:hypothetical protein
MTDINKLCDAMNTIDINNQGTYIFTVEELFKNFYINNDKEQKIIDIEKYIEDFIKSAPLN